jgi:uncharacterized membrane protein
MTFISLMQAAMFFLVFRDKLPDAHRAWPRQEELPVFVQFSFSHPEIFFVTLWALAVMTLVASVALLRRKDWARIYFIVVFALGCVWNIGGIWVQHQVLSSMETSVRQLPSDFNQNMRLFGTIMSIGSAVMAIAIAALFVWLIKRLMSPGVRREFNAL